jgi:ubiquinone/menaquinone biosynthesis C-methylase UbiE
MKRKEHWESIYQTKGPSDVSWFQARPAVSLDLIQASGLGKEQTIVDIGGGASALVDRLLDAGFDHLAVLDISAAALAQARERLGTLAQKVEWFEADVTEFAPPHRFDLWHDRAVFHFLTEQRDRDKYVRILRRCLAPTGHVIIATFALKGPRRCSGLEVVRYDSELIQAELGDEFELVQEIDETHTTPWDTKQRFKYFQFCRREKTTVPPRSLRSASSPRSSMPHKIYLDYNASTPIAPEVQEAIHPFLSGHYGNPSSHHWAGTGAKEAVERARSRVAALLGCSEEEMVFTSGGTESNNHAIKGAFLARRNSGNHIITTRIEHPAVLEPCRFLERLGAEVTYVPVDGSGMVDPGDVRKAIRRRTILVSVMSHSV